jgi:hypothetical protein
MITSSVSTINEMARPTVKFHKDQPATPAAQINMNRTNTGIQNNERGVMQKRNYFSESM